MWVFCQERVALFELTLQQGLVNWIFRVQSKTVDW
jgi:hypothetical protein